MFRLILTLQFFLVFPLVCVALGLGSWRVALLIYVLGLLAVGYFFRFSHRIFVRATRAAPVPESAVLGQMFFRALRKLKSKNESKYTPVVWTIPQAGTELQIWAHYSGKVDFFFSQGLVARLTETELEQIILKEYDLAKIRVSNRLYALALIFKDLKGPFGHFRYWYVSFWLYPLEQLLKIASI